MAKTDIDDFVKGLEAVFQGKATILNRMRLSCTFYDKEHKEIGSADDGRENRTAGV
jgi:NADH kinase